VSLACLGVGISGSRRLATGEAHLLIRHAFEAQPRHIDPERIESEITRFRQAVIAAQAHLQQVRRQIPADLQTDVAAFIDSHLLMLEDPLIAEIPIQLIRQHRHSAEWALQIQWEELVQRFDEMEDPLLRSRKDDVEHVVQQVQKALLEQHQDSEPPQSLAGRVIIAQDITPADAIQLRGQGIVAFVTEFGNPMSHTAILARSLGIPAVVGVRQATQLLHQGETLVVDGAHGVVLANLDPRVLSGLRQKIAHQETEMTHLRRSVDHPAVTKDGHRITLQANIEFAEDIHDLITAKAEGVGLYRTEFLYLNRKDIPDEEEHFENYLRIVVGLRGLPLTIRTLDLGADKAVDSCALPSLHSCNPALGLRALRLCLKEPDLIRPQLRAILRVSAYGRVRMLFPMLSSLRELLRIKAMVAETMVELEAADIPFTRNIPLGGMIEVPAAALSSAAFARHLDFFSIGTNDLIQYTLAVDRVADEVNHLFDPLHPAVLYLIKLTIEAARAAHIPVSLCGEMAGDIRYTRLLLGMGLREFSMQPGAILEVKRLVRESHLGRLERKVKELFAALDQDDMSDLIDDILS